MHHRLTLIAAIGALVFASSATASYRPLWHHTTDSGTVCNDNAQAIGVQGEDGFTLVSNPADAGPFETRADCLAYIAPTPAAAPQPADSYLWCNSQTEAAPFSLSLAESLTLSANWYRPLMVDGTPTCATTGLHTTGIYYVDSNGYGPSNQAQYDADVAYWGVASLYQTATR